MTGTVCTAPFPAPDELGRHASPAACSIRTVPAMRLYGRIAGRGPEGAVEYTLRPAGLCVRRRELPYRVQTALRRKP
jgi:hypothetical protein